MAERETCSARQEEGAPAPPWLRHERMTVRMELAAVLHHSASKSAGPETNDASRSQKTVNSREDAELFDLYKEEPGGSRPPIQQRCGADDRVLRSCAGARSRCSCAEDGRPVGWCPHLSSRLSTCPRSSPRSSSRNVPRFVCRSWWNSALGRRWLRMAPVRWTEADRGLLEAGRCTTHSVLPEGSTASPGRYTNIGRRARSTDPGADRGQGG